MPSLVSTWITQSTSPCEQARIKLELCEDIAKSGGV